MKTLPGEASPGETKEECGTILQEEIAARKIIAVTGPLAESQLRSLSDALLLGGVSILSVAFDPAAPDTWSRTAENISFLAGEYDGRLLPGAGNVLTMDQLNLAYEAGAKFIVSPHTEKDLIRRTKDLGLLCVAGAFTPTEIADAHKAGADFVKVFPVGSMGPNYIRLLQSSLSHVPMLAAGGVNEGNADDYRRAGAAGVEVGGKLTCSEWIQEERWTDIQALAAMYVKAVD